MDVAVIGGGLQGCAVALELAARGREVTLFERRPQLLDGASRHTEGKIHLGFVYAADESLRTARLMARGAAVFAPSLRRWLGARADALTTSAPFHYAVHRESLITPEELDARYARIAALIRGEIGDGEYFGVAAPQAFRRLERGEDAAFGPEVAAAFRTEELAVEPDALADAVAAVVARHPAITVHTGTRVLRVDRRVRRLLLSDEDGERESGPFTHVVNCAWCGRLELDGTAGIGPPPRWSFRMKYFGRAAWPAAIAPPPSTTIVLGAFGDVVDYGDGTVFLSWYPEGRRGWSGATRPPDWPARRGGSEGDDLAERITAGLAGVVPGVGGVVARTDHLEVRGGVIYARGDTDVSDPRSELHERHRVGPASHGAYHSVDTGKYTLAPLFAVELAERIAAADVR